MKRIICMLAAGVILTWGSAFADIPRTINFQGRLTDLSGGAVTDTTYTIYINLYTAAIGGPSIWTDTFSAGTKNGYFNVVLGSNLALKNKIDSTQLKFDQQYWVGITVGSDSEMSPRQPLQSATYALNAVGCVPIGAIVAWHQDMPGNSTPPLPPQFVPCNGQTLSDSESPYDHYVIPNLNGYPTGQAITVEGGGTTIDAMFLRGGLHSGVGQADAFQGHWHQFKGNTNNPPAAGSGCITGSSAGSYTDNGVCRNTLSDGAHGTPRVGSETRPINMSVIWIMRIK